MRGWFGVVLGSAVLSGGCGEEPEPYTLECGASTCDGLTEYCHMETDCDTWGPGVCKPLPERCQGPEATGDCLNQAGCEGTWATGYECWDVCG